MILPLVLATLLVSPPQPVAPITPAAAGVNASNVAAAANRLRLAVAYDESGTTHVAFVTREGAEEVTVTRGWLSDMTAVPDGFLLALQHPDRIALQLMKIGNDGSASEVRSLGLETNGVLAAMRARAMLFTETNELVLLDTDGNVVRRDIQVAREPMFLPAIAAGRSSFLLAWSERDTVNARLVDVNGNFLTDVITIGDGARAEVASDGRDFLVTWVADDGIRGRVITGSGEMPSPAFSIAPANPQDLSVTWDGARYVLTYTAGNVHRVDLGPGGATRAIEMGGRLAENIHIVSSSLGTAVAWVDRLGCALGGSRVMASIDDAAPVLVSIGPPRRVAPAAAAFGNTFATAWLEVTDVIRIHVRIGDRVIDLSSGYASGLAPVLAAAGDRLFVSWVETPLSNGCIPVRYAAVLDGNGELVRKFVIPKAISFWAAAASNGSEFVLLWSHFSHDVTDVSAVRVSREGELLDAPPRLIVRERVGRFSASSQRHLSLVWTGSEYLAVWERYGGRQIQLQRISPVLDPIGGVQTVGSGSEPRAAANAKATLIVYRDGTAVRARLVSHAGAVVPLDVVPRDGAVAVSAWGAEFVVLAGREVVRVTNAAAVVPMATLEDAVEGGRAVAASGGRVYLVYASDGGLVSRTAAAPRTRAVRH